RRREEVFIDKRMGKGFKPLDSRDTGWCRESTPSIQRAPPGRKRLTPAAPQRRVDGRALGADLEIQGRPLLAAGIAHAADDVAGAHEVAGLLRQRLVVGVKTHVSAA